MLVNLDRILISVSWEIKYPLCNAWSITRVGSDHAPILLETGEETIQKTRYFFFEKHWLTIPNFIQSVCSVWKEARDKLSDRCYSMNKWHSCITSVRQKMKGWDIQEKGQRKKAKKELLSKLEDLDKEADKRELTKDEWQIRYRL